MNMMVIDDTQWDAPLQTFGVWYTNVFVIKEFLTPLGLSDAN